MTLSVGNSSARWKLRAIPARTASCGRKSSRSAPSRWMLPSATLHTRLNALISVVLPAPLGPTSANTPVSGISRSSALTAVRPPKRTVSWRASSILWHRRVVGRTDKAGGGATRPQPRLQSAGEKQHDQHDHAAQDRQRQAADG